MGKLALQNRAALDYLLAGQGDTCAIIGDGCCTFVPDHSSNMTDLAEYIATVAKNNSPQPEWTSATWLESLFGSWGSQVAKWAAACFFLNFSKLCHLTCCECVCIFDQFTYVNRSINFIMMIVLP